MSVFGGDSWAREAQYRKRRVDDLFSENIDDFSFKKLSNGKFACLVCSHNPILDTPIMLSMHRKGTRHLASESKMKEKELKKQEEISKRIALSDDSPCTTNPNNCSKKYKPTEKPLIKHVQKVVSEVLFRKTSLECSKKEEPKVILNTGNLASSNFSTTSSLPATEVVDGTLTLQHFDFQERRERELKFTASGWKRDGHGKWYRDENFISLSPHRWSLILMKKTQISVLAEKAFRENFQDIIVGVIAALSKLAYALNGKHRSIARVFIIFLAAGIYQL